MQRRLTERIRNQKVPPCSDGTPVAARRDEGTARGLLQRNADAFAQYPIIVTNGSSTVACRTMSAIVGMTPDLK